MDIKAEIVSIGDELLIGQVIDTNSAWIARKLNTIGIAVNRINSISDNAHAIENILDEVKERVSLVILTGGLGPTKDDITKTSLSSYFQLPLYENLQVLEQVKSYIHNRGFSLNDLNRQQALVPENATILPNLKGTAPGMWIEKDGFICISLPGVPYEMMDIMEREGLPRLRAKFKTPFIIHKTVLVQGITESQLASKIEKWESALNQDVKLAYLPSPGRIRLRFSSTGYDQNLVEEKIEQEIFELQRIIPQHILALEDISIEHLVARKLIEKNLTIATAESCTGGRIASKITTIPGCSDFYKGSLVAYSNAIKSSSLRVSESLLIQYGAVSKEVVNKMLDGIIEVMDVNLGIAVSGIAGPDGGSQDKPIGTVWIGVGSSEKRIIREYHLGTQREQNIERASVIALTQLWELINLV